MAKINLGDKVRVKARPDWPSVPGYRLANAEGTVVKWIQRDDLVAEFQDYIHVRIEKTEVKEYVGNTMTFRVENLEKI